MTTHNENKKMTIKEFQNYLSSWQQGVERLEEEVKQLKENVQPKYEKQIADLRQQVKKLEGMLNAMKGDVGSISSTQWADAQVAFITLSQSFSRTAFQIRDEEKAPLGWLQGFTDARQQESKGWVEGMGQQPEGSEGWVEGIGTQSEESEGWVEGVGQKQ